MVWEIKVCRKCIKNLMSSSQTSVFPATKREAATHCSGAGSAEGWDGPGVLLGLGVRGTWCWHRSEGPFGQCLGAVLCLCRAGHVPGGGK